MKKWQNQFLAVASALGFTDLIKDGKLTAKEQKQIVAEYEKTYGVSFQTDREKNEDFTPDTQGEAVLSAEEITALAQLTGIDASKVSSKPAEAAKQAAEAAATANSNAAAKAARAAVLEKENKKLAAMPDTPSAPTVAAGTAISAAVLNKTLGRTAHSASHLFGIENSLFARGKWYNDIMLTRTPHTTLTASESEAFKSDFLVYAQALQARSKSLSDNNFLSALDYRSMVKGEGTIDYSDLIDQAGEYIVRRTDIILAYLRTLPSVAGIFPVVSNVQNKEVAPNANFGELSQGYRPGRIFKGNVNFSAEIYRVVDVMFKYLFEDLIKLEKQYIGYLNREGSAVIKWTFIEWILVHFGTILLNEQNRRRVMGVRVPQQDVESNPAMLSADGVLRAIERVEEELKVLPFSDLGVYDQSTMVDVVEAMWDKVVEILPSIEGYKLYLNAKHRQWYIRGYRSKYASDSDFTGAAGTPMADLAPDNLIWVPNMPVNCCKMWITLPDNVETYEDRPGEMFNFDFIRELEGIAVISRWKEGAGLLQAGIKHKTKGDLEAAGYVNQWLFTNDPTSTLTLAESIDLTANNLFAFTGTTAVTTVTGVSPERVYKFVAGAVGAKIAKSGAFEKISSDFTAVEAGDYVKVYAELEDHTETNEDGETIKSTRPTGKFLELERKVSSKV